MKSSADRIKQSNAYYDRFVAEVGARSEARDFSRAMDSFLALAEPASCILDIGCGSGLHLQEFRKRGFPSLGVEPSKKMRELVEAQGLKVIEGAFENLASLDLPNPGGIWCASSLLHVPKEELDVTFQQLKNLLPLGAPLFFTVRLGEGAKWDQFDGGTAEESRFIQLYQEEELLVELNEAGFKLHESWTEASTWGRPSRWISVIARRIERAITRS